MNIKQFEKELVSMYEKDRDSGTLHNLQWFIADIVELAEKLSNTTINSSTKNE